MRVENTGAPAWHQTISIIALPEILTKIQLETFLQQTEAGQTGHHWRLQFLLNLSLGGALASSAPAAPAPAHHSRQVVVELWNLGFSVLSQPGPADSSHVTVQGQTETEILTREDRPV